LGDLDTAHQFHHEVRPPVITLTPSPSPIGWERVAGGALTPSPSPIGWERVAGGALTPSPSPIGWERVAGGALTPSPSPIRWERVAGGRVRVGRAGIEHLGDVRMIHHRQ